MPSLGNLFGARLYRTLVAVGLLTNIKGETARFNGRKLGKEEMSVVPGEVNGTPWTITVKAEDGSSTHVYKVQIKNQ